MKMLYKLTAWYPDEGEDGLVHPPHLEVLHAAIIRHLTPRGHPFNDLLYVCTYYEVTLLQTHLKGTGSGDFRPFFCLKDSTWAPYEQKKTVSRRNSIAKFEKFSFFMGVFIFLNYCFWVC